MPNLIVQNILFKNQVYPVNFLICLFVKFTNPMSNKVFLTPNNQKLTHLKLSDNGINCAKNTNKTFVSSANRRADFFMLFFEQMEESLWQQRQSKTHTR